MAVEAFDLAERFQTPVFVASDLDIGMNDWMVPRFAWNDAYRPDRGKILGPAELERIEKFHRYLSTNGDGVAARTLPGVHPRGAYFTRGSGHHKFGGYTEDADEYIEVMDRLKRKIDGAAAALPAPHIDGSGGSVGIISLGGCHRAVAEAVHRLRSQGESVDYLRVRAFPFGEAVHEFVKSHERCFVVEQNRDAQLRSLLALETGVAVNSLHSILDYGGVPLSADVVVQGVAGVRAEVGV
jgi:2-oxoglutarate ferredoxin oxidoreductase subunit alpha